MRWILAVALIAAVGVTLVVVLGTDGGGEPEPAAPPLDDLPSAPEPAAKAEPLRISESDEPEFPWSQYGGSASHGNVVTEENTVTCPRVRWHVAEARRQPAIGHGTIYSGGRSLLRIQPDSGKVLASWRPKSDSEFPVIGTPAIAHDQVVVVLDDGGVASLKPDLSTVIWQRPPPHGHKGTFKPGALDGPTFVHALGSDVIAIDIRSGNEKWRRTVGSGAGTMTPAIHKGRVFVGTERGRFFALSLADGDIVWSHNGRAEFGWTDPVVAFGKVFMPDRGIRRERPGALNAFDEASGKPLWHTVFGATGFSMAGVRDRLLVGGFGQSVAYFDPDRGEMSPTPRIQTGMNAFGSPTFVGDTLFYGNLDGHLYAHDARSGALKWKFRLSSGVQVEGNVYRARGEAQVHDFVYSRGSIYVSTTRGLFALEQDPTKDIAPQGFVLTAPD